MHDFLEKILETTILLILWCNGSSGEANATAGADLVNRQSLIFGHFLNRRKIGDTNSLKERSDQSRSYYSSVPATPYVTAFDPISVLASLAFLAFLLQSFAALFDRTRSIIPTIISSRRSSSKYGDEFADIEKRILRSLEEYASLSNDLLDDEKESEQSIS